MTKPIQGDKFPEISLSLINGGLLTLPDQMEGRYIVLLFFRGNW